MNIEMTIVNRETIPNNRWTSMFRNINHINDKQAIRIIMDKKQTCRGLLTAWYRMCSKEYKKPAHSKVITHEAGATIWLWHD